MVRRVTFVPREQSCELHEVDAMGERGGTGKASNALGGNAVHPGDDNGAGGPPANAAHGHGQ